MLRQRLAQPSRDIPQRVGGTQRPTVQAPPAAQEEGLYIISVAARMLAMHPQTLRKYERVGLVRPSRTIGMLRLYSQEDIIKLQTIKHLVDEVRLNLAGVELVMVMVERLLLFRQRLAPFQETQWQMLKEELGEILEMLHVRQAQEPDS